MAARWASTRLANGRPRGTRGRGPPEGEPQKPRDERPQKFSTGFVASVGFDRAMLDHMRRFLWVLALCVACRPAEDPMRGELRARLKQETRLTPTEIHTLFEQIGPAIADRKVSVKEGALTRTLNDEQRSA